MSALSRCDDDESVECDFETCAAAAAIAVGVVDVRIVDDEPMMGDDDAGGDTDDEAVAMCDVPSAALSVGEWCSAASLVGTPRGARPRSRIAASDSSPCSRQGIVSVLFVVIRTIVHSRDFCVRVSYLLR